MASCYEYKCKENKLYIIVKNGEHRCKGGEILTIEGYSGGIFCPDNKNICHPRFNCKFGCVDKYSNSQPFFEYHNK